MSKYQVVLWPSVSELFAETFHAPLQSFVWRRHIGAQFWYTNMAAENQQKHLEYTFSTKAPSFHSRTSIRAHTNYLNGYTAENQENQPSFQNLLQISILSNI